ncbi:MAG TPA: hypothetical protein VFS67_34790 [Polyangiaceae bacterium]|nr:hypothetical protein [Polyangiaceae bacterium]
MTVPFARSFHRRAGAARAAPCVRRRTGWAVLLACLSVACGAALGAGEEASWPEATRKWFERARASFASLDIHDAQLSIQNVLQQERDSPAAHTLAASIALSQLKYDEALALLGGQTSAEARGLRARAYWYSGQLSKAADELDRLLDDPEVKDPWAEGVVQLARTGEGREPFHVTGALLAVVDMPRMPLPTLIVPLELNGEPVLAMVATGTPEVVIDSTQRKPAWVSLRFDRRLEVKDVPALNRDLSTLSRQLGAPIKLLLGVNLLRRLNVTFDFYASQFVVRTFEPPPPPGGTTLEVSYIKGGGMVTRGHFGTEANAPAAVFLVDTGVLFPIAVAPSGWQKAGVDPSKFESLQGDAKLKQGHLPHLTLGSFDLPRVPAMSGLPLDELEQSGGVRLDGVIGGALLAEFRASLVDEGRTLWLEEMPPPIDEAPPEQSAPAASSAPSAPPRAAR